MSVACGRKTSPIPPENNAPQAVEQLIANAKATGVEISWVSPSKTVRGKKLFDLSSFDVRSRLLGSKGSFKRAGRIFLDDSERKTSSRGEKISKRFVFFDDSLSHGGAYEYIVVPVNDYGTDGLISSILRVNFTGLSSSVESINAQSGNAPSGNAPSGNAPSGNAQGGNGQGGL